MSSSGVNVNYGDLSALAQQLANLRGEFQKGDDAIAPLLATITDDGLRSKLSSFAENWSHKRDELLTHLDQVAGFAKEAAAAYRGVDEAYAEGFARAGRPSGPVSPPTGIPPRRP